MPRHDSAYRSLFSHPAMMAELLQGVVRQPWLAQVDLSTLERINGEHVAARGGKRRTSDMVWRVWGKRDWVYVYLLLEFQSRNDPAMALRLLTYLGLLYEDILRQQSPPRGKRLPPVLPIVLYNGLPRWKATQQVSELIEPVAGLETYIPALRYLLLDEGALLAQGRLPADNLATLLFRLEHAADEEALRRTVQALVARLQGAGLGELERAFTAWLVDVLLPERAPGVSIPRVDNLQEFSAVMTAEKIDWSLRWKKAGREEGRQEGRQEGLQEGRHQGLHQGLHQGKAQLLERQLARRFGPVPESVRQRLAAASESELEAWALNVLDASALDAVFAAR